jgi:hypothetical protein
MVTHSSTSRPVQCLCMAERTGCPVLTDLWSYILILCQQHKSKFVFNGSGISKKAVSIAFPVPFLHFDAIFLLGICKIERNRSLPFFNQRD